MVCLKAVSWVPSYSLILWMIYLFILTLHLTCMLMIQSYMSLERQQKSWKTNLILTLKMYKSGAKKHRMAVNAEQTKVMLVTTYQRETQLQTSEIKVNFNNTMLENVISEKLLGVIIDKHLSWKHHIDKTSKTLSKNIALLKRSRKYLPHHTRLMFYRTFIKPHINYCSTIWGQSPHISHIHILQMISVRLIMNVPNLTHSAPLFKECQVMQIQDRVKFRTVTMV